MQGSGSGTATILRKESFAMRALVFCFVSMLAAATVSAQTSPQVQAQQNTIFAGADGKFESAPDTALLQFDLASQQDTARAAYDKVAAAADRVRLVLKNNEIDPKMAQVGFYSVQPMFDYKNPKNKVIGYRVVTHVTLKLHDFGKVGSLIEQTAGIDDGENQSLTYTLEDTEPAKAKAAEDALRRARNQAGAVATAGGRSLGELLFASVDVNQQVIVPVRMMSRAATAGAMVDQAPPTAGFSPQNVTINAHVNAMFALK
jgi:uncharacterized protein YggE